MRITWVRSCRTTSSREEPHSLSAQNTGFGLNDVTNWLIDAKYVHFFLEKVPSLAIAHFTPLDPLNEILSALPVELQAPPLRTRALARTFKRQWEGAVLDLTQALRVVEDTKRSHKPDQQQLELASKMREEREAWNTGSKDWRSVPQLKDEEQPSSLEAQLLFDRAEAYLALACQSVPAALDGLKEYQAFQGDDEVDDVHHAQAQAVRLEARKKVKAYARRALKDYLAFLSNFDYTPGLSIDITNEIMRRVYDLANGNKTQTPLPKDRFVEVNSSEDESSQSGRASGNESNNSALVKHQHPKQDPPELGENGSPKFSVPKIYPSSALFAEKPLPDLPRFPARDPTTGEKSDHEALGFYEAVTYHPLLNEALHSLLLAHALLQTSPTEHLRHAHNVARLARIADGYPIFQPARSPACSDWTEILRRANNWIGLGTPWQELCTPEPLPETAGGWAKKPSSTWSSNELFPPAAHSSAPDVNETSEQKRERIKQESIADALSDDRVVDEESYYRAVRARERRAFEDEEGLSGPLKDKTDSDGRQARNDIADDYLISTERAEAIARWIREAPLSVGGKKKRPARKKRPAGNGADEVADRVQGLTINERMGGGNAQLKA